MPFTADGKNLMLTALDETPVAPTVVASHASLHSAYSATGTNELTGGTPAYARKALVWAAAATGTKAAAQVTFDVAAAGVAAFVGLWSALTAGTFLGMFPASGEQLRTFAMDDATADLIDSPAHGYVNTNTVVFWTPGSGALPAGITEGTIYYVIGATADTFQISLTSGGAAVAITGLGKGTFQRIVVENFAGQGTFAVTPTLDLNAV